MAAGFSVEGFLRVCAWCRKINHKNEWILPDQGLAVKFHGKTTHGICPVCLENARLHLRKKRAECIEASTREG